MKRLHRTKRPPPRYGGCERPTSPRIVTSKQHSKAYVDAARCTVSIELECQDVDLECQDVDDWANETNSPRGVQKHDIADGVDLPLTAILDMFPETVEPIGEDQKQLYHELALHTNTCSPAGSAHSRSHQAISYDIQAANRNRATSTAPAYAVYIRT
jgi:hypothetical protein